MSVTRPLDRRQPSLRRATLLVAALWIVAAVIALLPLSSQTVEYFGEEFYGGNGVCLPLHVQDPFAQVSNIFLQAYTKHLFNRLNIYREIRTSVDRSYGDFTVHFGRTRRGERTA